MPPLKKLVHSEAVCLDCPTAFGFDTDLTRVEVEDRADMHRRGQTGGHRVVVYDGIGRLKEELQGAKIVSYDEVTNIVFAWFGGHGIHAYEPDGKEMNVWSVGDFKDTDATRQEVHRGIERIKRQMKMEGEDPR